MYKLLESEKFLKEEGIPLRHPQVSDTWAGAPISIKPHCPIFFQRAPRSDHFPASSGLLDAAHAQYSKNLN